MCHRQGWLWEYEDTTYDYSLYHQWCQCPWIKQEPNAQELCATINQTAWYGRNCSEHKACLCEKPIIIPEQEEGECPFGWKKYGDKCFLMTSKGLSYDGCVETCMKGQGLISSAGNPQEHEVLVNL